MTQFQAIKKVENKEAAWASEKCRKNSLKGRIQCEQIIQAIRLMNFRSFL
jgi:hypothetical protein